MRAFWYPPYPGATVEIGGQILTVVDRTLLEAAAAANRAAGRFP